MQTVAPSSVMWQRRTNRLIAAAIIVIGLTMMISNVSQCIYIGMLFIVLALVWLARMAIADRKLQPPRPEHHASPVLFLVTSNMLPRINRPTAAIANDKPPSYDQIISLDGQPPDYNSIIHDQLPQYHEVVAEDSLRNQASSSVSITVNDLPDYSGSEVQGPESVAISEVNISESPKSDEPATSSRVGSLWNSFTRGISLTSSFSLPKKEQTSRKRNLSSTSSGATVLNKSDSGTGLVRLHVSNLPHDTPNTSKYLSNTLDSTETSTDFEVVSKDYGKSELTMSRRPILQSMSSTDSSVEDNSNSTVADDRLDTSNQNNII